jgi:hypothetical protein
MAKLPVKSIKDRMNAVVHVSFPRPHLGGSVVGHACKRYVFYSFRWAYKNRIESKLNRIFRIGDAIEDILVKELSLIGIEVRNSQRQVDGHRGHAGGSTDGDCFIDGEDYLFEAKSMNHTNFLEMQRKKCEEAKPQYYNQVQIYMGKLGLKKTLFICMDKNTSEIYVEIIKFDEFTYEMLLAKEEEVIDAVHINTFPKLSQNPAWFQCKFCDAKEVCHQGTMPTPNCRNCEHVEIHDEGLWGCGLYGEWLTEKQQQDGCVDYRVSPIFLNEA